MLAQRRRAGGIAGEVGGIASDLTGEQVQHRVGHRLTRHQCASGMTEIAELHRMADPVRTSPTPYHLHEIVRTEGVESFDRRVIGRRVEDRGALRR